MLSFLSVQWFLLFLYFSPIYFSYSSNIYQNVKDMSSEIWRYERYKLLKEFQSKPLLPFPFSIPENLFMLFKYCRPGPNREFNGNVQPIKNIPYITYAYKYIYMYLFIHKWASTTVTCLSRESKQEPTDGLPTEQTFSQSDFPVP